MVFLEFKDHYGNDADYFITTSDQFGMSDILKTHKEINNVYTVGSIIGFSEYCNIELGLDIFYKEENNLEDEFKNRSKSLLINNIEINILEQIFNIFMCINIGESEVDGVVDNAFKYIKTMINGINYLDDDSDNKISFAYGHSEEWILNEILSNAVNEYCMYVRSIIKTHKKRIINEVGCMDVTQCVNNVKTGLAINTINIEDIPTSVILYEYNTIETFHTTDMSNMFEDSDDEIISFIIRYKLYASKEYYNVVKDVDGYKFVEKV